MTCNYGTSDRTIVITLFLYILNYLTIGHTSLLIDRSSYEVSVNTFSKSLRDS